MTLFPNKLAIKSAFLTVSAALLMGSPAMAQDAGEDTYGLSPDVPVDLETVSCWDVVTLNEDDRAYVMTMLYGYAAAKKGTSTISPEAVQVAIVLTMTDCVEKPDDKVHAVLLEKMARREE